MKIETSFAESAPVANANAWARERQQPIEKYGKTTKVGRKQYLAGFGWHRRH
jgi:hypothetical protein